MKSMKYILIGILMAVLLLNSCAPAPEKNNDLSEEPSDKPDIGGDSSTPDTEGGEGEIEKQEDFKYIDNGDGTVTITGININETDVVVVSEIAGKTVAGIGSEAFSGKSDIRTLTIPATVEKVGKGAFDGWNSCQTVLLTSGVCTVGWDPAWDYGCFAVIKSEDASRDFAYDSIFDGLCIKSYDGKLRNITIPTFFEGKVVTSIADRAFADLNTIASIMIPESIKVIGNEAFAGWTDEQQIIVSAGISTSEWKDDWEKGSNADEVIAEGYNEYTLVPLAEEGTYRIDEYRGKLRKLTIPSRIGDKTIKEIGEHIGNGFVKEIKVEGGIDYAGWWAFSDFTSLKEIRFEASMPDMHSTAFEKIGGFTVYYPFSEHDKIKDSLQNASSFSVVLTDEPKTITNKAYGDTGITDIVLPETVEAIDDCAFFNCPNLKTLILPAGLKKIGYSAFYNGMFSELTIPDTVTEVGRSAFGNFVTEAVLHIGENTDVARWDELWGEDYNGYIQTESWKAKCNNNGFGIVEYLGNAAEITIPDTVAGKTVDRLNGINNTTVKKVTVQKNVEIYGPEIFNGCASLDEIVCNYDTQRTVDLDAFKGLNGTKVNLTYEGSRAFYKALEQVANLHLSFNDAYNPGTTVFGLLMGDGDMNEMKNLVSIEIPESITEIRDHAVRNCTGLESIVIPKNVTRLDAEGYAGIPDLTLYFGEGMEVLPPYAIANTANVKAVHLPESLRVIGIGAFEDNLGLTELELPEGVVEICDDVFRGAANLLKVTIPGSIRTMGKNIFNGIRPEALIVFKPGITRLPDNALYGSNILKANQVIIPPGCIEIGDYAFAECQNLEEVYVLVGIVKIGEGAYDYCQGLKKVLIPNLVTDVGYRAFHNINSEAKILVESGTNTVLWNKDWAEERLVTWNCTFDYSLWP